ncbi:MAG: L,D-transpeptidase [Chloroflexota bacterium]
MFTTKISELSRREFLKLNTLGLLGAFLPQIANPSKAALVKYGRVMDTRITMFDRPSFQGNPIKSYAFDNILTITGSEQGDKFPLYNQIWYQIQDQGFIHSAQLQPVAIQFNAPDSSVPIHGNLSEVTVPFADALVEPIRGAAFAYRYYYSSTHWVDKHILDINSKSWYRVRDDQKEDSYYFVPAEHLRIIPSEETDTLSPEVPLEQKRIEVNTNAQIMIAYEGSDPVFISTVSLGDKGSNPQWRTPLGPFKTFYKRPSRHMAAGNRAFGDYDLPGVPWVSYINTWGIAFHGTYWHNDYGRPRSHGCINLTPEGAKWVYRWTMPHVPYDAELKYLQNHGTQVNIV